MSLEELVDVTGVAPDLIKDLEDWRLVQPESLEGTKFYDDTDREIVQASAELARFGVGGRNLKVLRTAADREAQLLEAVVGRGAAAPPTTTPAARRSRTWRASPPPATTSPTCCSSAICGS